MFKRILSIFLCAIILTSTASFCTQAEEISYYQIMIDAGANIQTEKAIVDGDELYIAASSFEKYTRFEFDAATRTFLVKGQEEDKAFKKVIINPEKKKVAVGTKVMDLTNSFVVNNVVYLPFCQMLPILNADIIEVDQDGVIHIVNNKLSMAELLYDFDIQEYWFDINEEFFGKVGLLIGLVAPSYIFDSVVHQRFNRLDIVFQSGACEDYQTIFQNYVKDDDLFQKAMGQKNSAGELLEAITGVNKKTEILYDVYEWFDKVEAIDETLKSDKLVKYIQKITENGVFVDELEEMVKAVHDDNLGEQVSVADVFEGIDFLYSYLNQVDDHRKMLDAVYCLEKRQTEQASIEGLSKSFIAIDPEYLAAKKIYELYKGNIIPTFTEKATHALFEEMLKDITEAKTTGMYSLTANLTGEILELYLPGDSGEVALLPQHNNIANSAMVKATVPTLETEASTATYRLSLLLTLLASRACYDIMNEITSGYGQESAYYQRKIDEIEKMIMGLYIIADNTAFDTYENYASFEKQNKNIIKNADLLKKVIPYPPVDEVAYLEFLKEYTEYHYYAVLDINGDGVLEMLATEDVNYKLSPTYLVDLFVYKNGKISLEYKDIWAKYEVLLYDDENHWIAQYRGGSSGEGMSFYYLDKELCVCEVSFDTRCDEVDEYGQEVWRKYYNGTEVHEGNRAAYDQLVKKWNKSKAKEIVFKEIPQDKSYTDNQVVQERVNEIEKSYGVIQNNISTYTVEDGGSDTTRYVDKAGKIRKIIASPTTYADLEIDSKYTAEYYYEDNMLFLVHLTNQTEQHSIYIAKNDYTVCVRYVDAKGTVYDYPSGKSVNELPVVGQYCTLGMMELHWFGVIP